MKVDVKEEAGILSPRPMSMSTLLQSFFLHLTTYKDEYNLNES